MQEEWGNDQGLTNAPEHRAQMLSGLRMVRKALDDFKPDAVIVWGDDQYENFREDIIPAFCVLAYQEDTVECKPWGATPNHWGESNETEFHVKSAPEIGKYLVSGLLGENFDVAYAYKPLHYPGLPHAFINAVLYLDYDRKGFPYPVVPFQVNCYGRFVISHKGIGFPYAEANKPSSIRRRPHRRAASIWAARPRACSRRARGASRSSRRRVGRTASCATRTGTSTPTSLPIATSMKRCSSATGKHGTRRR